MPLMSRRRLLLLFVALLVASLWFGDISFGRAQQGPVLPTNVPHVSNTTADRFIRADRLGITFISSAQIDPVDARYQNALLLGAGWTRWPLYWDVVEGQPGLFDWTDYDRLVMDDMRFGLQINAILLDRPEFYAGDNVIAGLREPIFADGTDLAAAGKPLNPDNFWANFVFLAVERYRPGGLLAQQMGWTNGEGIRLWEVWNEPDLPAFWQGGINNYARLLKVAYIAAHHADPDATVMFGGLLYNTDDNWLARVLNIYQNDPQRTQNNWYMDAVAVHSYSYPWRSGWLTLFTDDTLKAFGLERPIIMNESGVGVWDDYPGPVWADSADQRLKLGTADQAAWFFIQSTAYAWSEGADLVFFHQLYDDCGDEPPGTDFPPHNGELCTGDNRCFGNSFGLFRNTTNALCYSQHPNPGSPRPAATAYRLMAEVFGTIPFENGEAIRAEGITDIRFDRPATNERVHVIWNRRFEPNTALIPAEGSSATLHTLRGSSTIFPQDGSYQIPLRAAEPDNFPELNANDVSAIGGEPIILIEAVAADLNTITTEATPAIRAEPASGTAIAPIQPTPGPVIQQVQPTIAPENDRTAPVPIMEPLPEVSGTTFTVQWGAQDDGGVDRYVVWVQIDDGEWLPWLETARTEGIYTGVAGNSYRFAVWVVDLAGNWSSNTDLTPLAETRVE